MPFILQERILEEGGGRAVLLRGPYGLYEIVFGVFDRPL